MLKSIVVSVDYVNGFAFGITQLDRIPCLFLYYERWTIVITIISMQTLKHIKIHLHAIKTDSYLGLQCQRKLQTYIKK